MFFNWLEFIFEIVIKVISDTISIKFTNWQSRIEKDDPEIIMKDLINSLLELIICENCIFNIWISKKLESKPEVYS